MILIITSTTPRHSGMFVAGIHLIYELILLFRTHYKYRFQLQTCWNDDIEKIKRGISL
jgi:hypothetical protein